MSTTYLVLGSEGLVCKAFCKYLTSKNIKYIEWDLKLGEHYDLRCDKNMSLLQEKVDESDYILFAAYDVGGAKFLTSSETDSLTNNLKLMANTFSTLKNKKFIFISSQMVSLTNNPYGASKRIGEIYTRMLNGLIIRLWNVYDEEDVSVKSHVVPDFINQAMTTSFIQMLTDGNEVRQFMHADDCARALYTLFENYDHFKTVRDHVDVSNNVWTSIHDVAATVQRVMNNNIKIIKGDKITSYQDVIEPDCTELLKYWKPEIDLKHGIRRIIESKDVHRRMPQPHNYVGDIIKTTLTGTGDSDKHLLTLFSLVVQLGARNILELGVRSGTTTLPLLLGAQLTHGTVTSVDIKDTTFECPQHLKNRWTFIRTDSIDYLKSTKTKCWDLVYIDDWHSCDHVKKELDLLDRQSDSKTLIVLHDLMYANYEPHYHVDLCNKEGQWANGGPYKAVSELNANFWEFATIPVCNGLTILRKKYTLFNLRK